MDKKELIIKIESTKWTIDFLKDELHLLELDLERIKDET